MAGSEVKTKENESKEEKRPSQWQQACLICGTQSPEPVYENWICEHCRVVVQAEAVAKKRKIEKEGGGPS